jgi:hypothetical protein
MHLSLRPFDIIHWGNSVTRLLDLLVIAKIFAKNNTAQQFAMSQMEDLKVKRSYPILLVELERLNLFFPTPTATVSDTIVGLVLCISSFRISTVHHPNLDNEKTQFKFHLKELVLISGLWNFEGDSGVHSFELDNVSMVALNNPGYVDAILIADEQLGLDIQLSDLKFKISKYQYELLLSSIQEITANIKVMR